MKADISAFTLSLLKNFRTCSRIFMGKAIILKGWLVWQFKVFKGKDYFVMNCEGVKNAKESIIFSSLSYDLDYMRAVVKQDPFLSRDERLMVEWVAKGKHILSIVPTREYYDQFKEVGAPIDFVIFKETKETLGGSHYNLALIDSSPHPKAARLFANWFLSREGQNMVSKFAGHQSAREDTNNDHLRPEDLRESGKEYFIETEEFILKGVELAAVARDVFGPLVAR